jgi:hypothetical protein
MNRWSTWVVAMLVVALVGFSGQAQDKKEPEKKDAVKKDGDKKDGEKKDDKKPPLPTPKVPDMKDAQKNLVKTGTIAGELVHVESGKQGFRVKVTYTFSELNQNEYRAMLESQAHAQQCLARRDVKGYQDHLRNALTHQSKLYSVKSADKTFDLEAKDDMVVRLPEPKTEFDEMGNVKKPTPKEVEAMRGKDRMFNGEFSDLTTGQIVQVTLILPKPMKPLNKDDIQLDDKKLEATRVAVLRQPKLK